MKYLFNLVTIFRGIIVGLIFISFPIIAFTLITSKTDFIPGYKSFIVLTGSMTPLIQVGSVVYVHKSNDYQLGDIISFHRGDIIVTHRIIDIEDETGKSLSRLVSPLSGETKKTQVLYKTKGDANISADAELVSENKLIGKALFHFPYVGYFISFMRTPLGFALCMLLPTLSFICLQLWSIKKELENNIERKFSKRYDLL